MPDTQPALQPLPSGRHRLTRAAVAESQRGRLLFAVAKAVADNGYAATTVADVVERASVSRRTFYEQFDSLEACFLAAFDMGVEIVLGRLAEAAADVAADDWRALTLSDIATYLEILASEPAFAWALHVEMFGAGPAAMKRRDETFGIFSERTKRLYALARKEDSDLPRLPDEAFLLHSGGVDELIRHCLRTDGPDALPKLAKPIAATTIAFFSRRPG
jgi:AcrR family transcriptional regulator